MNVIAVLWAFIGALLGASAWAGISYLTGYQIGYMAIAVGAMVGGGARLAGGEGKPMALCCAGMALVAMFVGNVMAVQMALEKTVNDLVEMVTTPEAYEEGFRLADQFVLYTTEESYPQFIIENTGYSLAETPEEVTEEEIEIFLEEMAPELRRLHEERPNYDVWVSEQKAWAKAAVMQGGSLSQYVLESLGIMDALFAFLGLGAAVRIVGEWE